MKYWKDLSKKGKIAAGVCAVVVLFIAWTIIV
jgi:hypothetical protein